MEHCNASNAWNRQNCGELTLKYVLDSRLVQCNEINTLGNTSMQCNQWKIKSYKTLCGCTKQHTTIHSALLCKAMPWSKTQSNEKCLCDLHFNSIDHRKVQCNINSWWDITELIEFDKDETFANAMQFGTTLVKCNGSNEITTVLVLIKLE